MYEEKNLLEELEEIVRLSKQPGQILTRDMREAVQVAEELREIVQQTYNTKTNQMNLNAFEDSLKKAGTSLSEVNNKLSQLGAKGTDANSKLSRSVMNVNTQLKETSYLANHAKKALENVAFYNVGTMGVNAFTSKVKEGVKYLKELNKSLTQIREVSGMAEGAVRKLAEDGSKIAENIGATTLEYTKAALIYAQQGLTGDELKQRTEITLKLAKVLGQEAQHVSENLTAIWNNYADGQKTLESYADVIAKLGATTAASTEEISKGLQSLGGIGKTIGLSYEYASSMVATLVATTRESASSVGTSLKTLSARLQDLKLGKTLEDGTTLGKYGKALEAVGVNIKDQAGNLKDMDQTLDELGQKWGSLRKDEQVALAKGVAGVREYAKFATLMSNWDFMKKNVNTAMNSAGELAKQQSVYMESLEAKEQKLAERWEHLFNSEDAEKGLGKTLDLMSNMIGTVDKLVSSFGGLHGALLGIGSMVAFVFRDQIANSIAKSRYEAQKMREEEQAFNTKKEIVERNKGKSNTPKSSSKNKTDNNMTLNSLLSRRTPPPKEDKGKDKDKEKDKNTDNLPTDNKSSDNKIKNDLKDRQELKAKAEKELSIEKDTSDKKSANLKSLFGNKFFDELEKERLEYRDKIEQITKELDNDSNDFGKLKNSLADYFDKLKKTIEYIDTLTSLPPEDWGIDLETYGVPGYEKKKQNTPSSNSNQNTQNQPKQDNPSLKFLTGENGKGLGKDVGIERLASILETRVIDALISLTTQRTGKYVDKDGNWSKNGGKKFNQKSSMQTQKFADNLEFAGLKDEALKHLDDKYKNASKEDLKDIDIIKQIINKGSFTNSQGQESRKLKSNGETAGAYSKVGELHKHLGSIIGSVSGGGLLGILRNINAEAINDYGELQKNLTTDANKIAEIEKKVTELQNKLQNLQKSAGEPYQKNTSYVMNKKTLPKHHDGTDLAKLLADLANKRNSGKRIVKKDLGNFLDIYDNIEKLNSDEYLAILQQGEVVFTKKQFETVKQAFLDRDDAIVSKVLDEIDKKKSVGKRKKAVDDVPDLTKDIDSKLKANQKRNDSLKKNNLDDIELNLSAEDFAFLDSIDLKPKKQKTQTKKQPKEVQKEEPKQKQQELPKTYEEAKKAVNSLTSAFNSFAKEHKDPFAAKTKSATDKIKVYQKALDDKMSDDYNLTEQEAKEMAKTTKRDKNSGAVVQGLSRKALYEKAQFYFPNTKELYSKINFSGTDKDVQKNFKEAVEGKDKRYIRDSDFMIKEEDGDIVADAKQSMDKTKQLFDLVDQTISLIGEKMSKELEDMKALRDKLKAESEKTSQPTGKTEKKITPREDWKGSKDPEAKDFFDDLYEQELHELKKGSPLKDKNVKQTLDKDLFKDISEERQEYIEETTKLIKEYEKKLKKDENANTAKEEQKIEDYLQAIRDTDDYIKELTTSSDNNKPTTNQDNSNSKKEDGKTSVKNSPTSSDSSKKTEPKKEKKFKINIAEEQKTENDNNKGKVNVKSETNNKKDKSSSTPTNDKNNPPKSEESEETKKRKELARKAQNLLGLDTQTSSYADQSKLAILKQMGDSSSIENLGRGRQVYRQKIEELIQMLSDDTQDFTQLAQDIQDYFNKLEGIETKVQDILNSSPIDWDTDPEINDNDNDNSSSNNKPNKKRRKKRRKKVKDNSKTIEEEKQDLTKEIANFLPTIGHNREKYEKTSYEFGKLQFDLKPEAQKDQGELLNLLNTFENKIKGILDTFNNSSLSLEDVRNSNKSFNEWKSELEKTYGKLDSLMSENENWLEVEKNKDQTKMDKNLPRAEKFDKGLFEDLQDLNNTGFFESIDGTEIAKEFYDNMEKTLNRFETEGKQGVDSYDNLQDYVDSPEYAFRELLEIFKENFYRPPEDNTSDNDDEEFDLDENFPDIESDLIEYDDDTETDSDKDFPNIESDLVEYDDEYDKPYNGADEWEENNFNQPDEYSGADKWDVDEININGDVEVNGDGDVEVNGEDETRVEDSTRQQPNTNMPEILLATDFVEASPDDIEAKALEREVELTEKHLQIKQGLTQEENNRLTQLTQLIVEEEKDIDIAKSNIGYLQETVGLSNSFIESLRNGEQPITAIRTELEKYSIAFRNSVTNIKQQEDGTKRLSANMNKLVQQVTKVEQVDGNIVAKVRQYLVTLDQLNKKEKLTTEETQKIKILVERIQEEMLKSVSSPILGSLDQIKKKTQEASQFYEEYSNLTKKGEMFANVKKVTSVVTGAMSSMSMAWSSMSSIMQTLEDNEMSLMDKTQQLAMTFGMAGGMFKSAFAEIDRQFGGDGKFLKSLVNNLKMPGVAKELSTVRKEMKTLTVAGKQATEQFSELATKEQALSKQLGEGTASAGGVALGVGLIAAMAVVAAWSAALEKIKEQEQALTETRRKKAQEDQEQIEQYNKEAEGLDAVSNGLEDLKTKYDNGQISIGQMRAETYKLCEQYDIEAEKLGVLTGDYEQLAEAIRRARHEKAQEGVNKSESGKTDAMSLAKNATNKINKDNFNWLDAMTWGRGDKETIRYKFFEDVEKGDIDMISSILGSNNVKTTHLLGQNIPGSYGVTDFDINNEKVIKNYDSIIKQLNKEVENGSYAAKDLLKAMTNEDYINAKNLYLDSLKTEYEQKRKIAELDTYKEEDIKSYQDYAKQRAELKEKYQKDEYGFEDQKDENGKVIKTKDEQIEDYINNLFMQSNNSTIQGYVAQDERNKQFQDLIVNGNEEQKKELTETFDTLPTKIQEALLKNKIEVSVTDTAEDLKNKTAGTGDVDLTGLSSVDKILQAVKQGNVNESTYQEKREQGKSTDKVENALGKNNESLNSSVQNLIEQYDVSNLMKDFNNKSQEEQIEVLEKVVELAGRRANFEQQTTGDIEKQKQELEKQQEQLGFIQELKKKDSVTVNGFNTVTNIENDEEFNKKYALNDFDNVVDLEKDNSDIQKIKELTESLNINTTGKTLADVLKEVKESLVAASPEAENFKKIWDGLDDEGKKKLQAELNLDDKDIKSKIEDVNNKLKKLTKDPYTVKMEIEDNFMSVMENKVGLFTTKVKEQIADMSKLIGKGFTIDPNNFDKLMKVYPELGKNAKLTSDGMIDMDDKVTKKFIANKKKEMKAEYQKNVQAIDNKIGQIDMEIKYHEEQLKLGEEALKDDKKLKSYYADSEKIAQEFKQKLIGETEKVVDKSEIDAQLANNSTTLKVKENLSEINKDIITTGQLWSKALLGELTGEEKTVSAEGYDTSKINTLSKKDIENTTEDIYNNYSKKQMQSYVKAANSQERKYLKSLGNQRNTLLGEKGRLKIGYEQGINGLEEWGTGGTDDRDQKEFEKHIDETYDKFVNLKQAIENTTRALERLDKVQSHYYGEQKINSLAKENKMINQQIKNYRNLERAQRRELGVLRSKLSAYAKFNKQGQLIDFYAAFNRIKAEYNKAIDTYNSVISRYNNMAKDLQESTGKKLLSDAENNLNKAKERFDKSKNDLEKYKNLMNEYQDTLDKQQDLFYQKVENTMERLNTRIELKIDTSATEKQLADFFLKISKKTNQVTQSFMQELLTGQDNTSRIISQDQNTMTQVNKDIKTHQSRANNAANYIRQAKKLEIKESKGTLTEAEKTRLASIRAARGIASLSEATQQLKQANEDLLEDYGKIEDAVKDGISQYMNFIEQYKSGIDEINNKFDTLTTKLEHQMKLTELVYGAENYGEKSKVLDQQIHNTENQLEALVKARDNTLEQYNTAVKKYGENSQQAKALYAEYESTAAKVDSLVEQYIEKNKERLINSINEAYQEAEKALTGGSSYDFMYKQWELTKKQQSAYYDETERLYQLEKMRLNLQQKIDNTKELKAQQKLKEFADYQLNYLEQKKELTKEDVELAEKRLSVVEAEIALENAQKNKSQMQVTRDSSGNWSYDYVADEGDIAKKKQELLDAQNAVYEFTKTKLLELQENVAKVTQEGLKALEEYDVKMAEIADKESDEYKQLAKEKAELQELYFGENGIVRQQQQQFSQFQIHLNKEEIGSIVTLCKVNADSYKDLTKEQQDLFDTVRRIGMNSATDVYDYSYGKYEQVSTDSRLTWKTAKEKAKNAMTTIQTYQDTVLGKMVDKINKDKKTIESFLDKVNDKVKTANDKFTKAMRTLETKTGVNIKNVNAKIKSIGTESDKVKKKMNTFIGDSNEGFTTMNTKLGNILSTYQKITQEISKSVSANQSLMDSTNKTITSNNLGGGSGSSSSSGSSGSSSSSGSSGGGSIKVGKKVKILSRGYHDSFGSTPPVSEKLVGKTYYVNIESAPQYGGKAKRYGKYPIHLATKANSENANDWIGWFAPSQVQGLKTGGYTGDWNKGDNDGRLALLHQKELVLNKEDTEKVLKAVKMVREMGNSIESLSKIDFNEVIKANKINFDKYLNVPNITPQKQEQETSNNTFNIRAEFPNANNVDEIREAILSLPNLASQYTLKR